MNVACKVCGTQLRAGAKFCNKCGVPLSLIERFGAKLAGSKSEMTVVGGAQLPDDDDVPTVDSPRLAPTADPAVGNAPASANPSRLAPTVDPALAPTVDVAGRPPVSTPHQPAPPVSPQPPAPVAPPVLAQRIAPPVALPASPAAVQTVDSPVLQGRGPRHILLTKPTRTILFVFIFAALPLFIPSLGTMLGLKDTPYSDLLPDPRELITFKSSGGSNADAGIGGGSTETETTTVAATGADDPVVVGSKNPVEDPARAMDNFYASLALTQAKQPGAVTRVTHYGDSPITNDGITSTVRRLLQ